MSKSWNRWLLAACALAFLGPVAPVSGQQAEGVDPTNPLGRFVYPAGGQSPEQQQADQQECYDWASQQTGFNPYEAYQQALAAQQQAAQAGQPQGDVVRGVAAGAITGLIIGEITGDASEGAAIGAASGALLGGMKRRSRRRSAEQEAQQQQAQAEALLNSWDQAYMVCLQGKDYTVGLPREPRAPGRHCPRCVDVSSG